jgi:hypothetical protein
LARFEVFKEINMKITEEFNFDEGPLYNVKLKEKIKQVAHTFENARRNNRDCCIACLNPDYSYAFEKQGSHYVQCKKCSTLYISNPIVKEQYLEYKAKILEVYKDKSIQSGLKKLYEQKLFSLEVNLNRLFFKKKRIQVGYSGFKHPEFSRILEKKFPQFGFGQVQFRKQEKFDFIILDNLIENLLEPRMYVEKIFHSLAKNGYVYVTTRLGSGIDILMLWEESKIIPLEHLNLFSKEGIESLFYHYFNITSISTPGILDVKMMLETDYGKLPPFLKYLKKHRGHDITEDFQYFLQKNQLSSYLVMLAQKKDAVEHVKRRASSTGNRSTGEEK